MRLLHTSDWHLGRSFHGASLLENQRAVLEELVRLVKERHIDVVLISGDIYDRALPQVDAVKLCNSILGQLRAAGAKVIITSGNHDSAARLGFAAELIDAAGVHIIADTTRMSTPVMVQGEDHQIAVYGIPYLEPRMVMAELEAEKLSHESVVAAAVTRIQQDLATRRAAADTPVLAFSMAHLFAAGGVGSDSERELSVGNLDVVPVELFGPFDYSALGHLHGRQRLSHTVRYSGSPLAYSFSEANQRKAVWIIDTDASGVKEIEAVELSVPKKLAILRGKLQELLEDPELAWAEEAWCQVTLTDTDRPAEAMTRIRTRFPDTVVLLFAPEASTRNTRESYAQRLARAKSTKEVCTDFIDHVRHRPADEHEQELVASVIRSVREAGSEK